MKLFENAQIGKWDAYTMERDSITSLELMERAAMAIVRYLLENHPHQEYFVFCGSGNNGGDGLAISRILIDRGLSVHIIRVKVGKPSPDNLFELKLLKERGIPVHLIEEESDWMVPESGIILDCLLGTRIRYPLPDLVSFIINQINQVQLPIISVDIPSGIRPDLEEGVQASIHPAIRATKTLCLEIPKLSALVPGTGAHYGQWISLKIDLHADFIREEITSWFLTSFKEAKDIFKPRKNFDFKGDYGHSLVFAGSYGKAGAAALCAKSCVRSGSGLVTLFSPEINAGILQSDVEEAMFLPGGGDKILESLPLQDWEKYDAIGVGPGIGTDPKTREIVLHLIRKAKKPLVIDADGLNILAGQKDMDAIIPPGTILTPHVGEFNRITQGGSKDPVTRIHLGKDLAGKTKSVIILKGAFTAVIFPNQEVHFNATGNPGMATGGSGDVLTGILTALRAQGYTSEESALLGVYIHGRAGDLAKNVLGETALKAGDICQFLGEAFLELEKSKNSF